MRFLVVLALFCLSTFVAFAQFSENIAPTLKPSEALCVKKYSMENSRETTENTQKDITQKEIENPEENRDENDKKDKFFTNEIGDSQYNRYGGALMRHEQNYYRLLEQRRNEYINKMRTICSE